MIPIYAVSFITVVLYYSLINLLNCPLSKDGLCLQPLEWAFLILLYYINAKSKVQAYHSYLLFFPFLVLFSHGIFLLLYHILYIMSYKYFGFIFLCSSSIAKISERTEIDAMISVNINREHQKYFLCSFSCASLPCLLTCQF